MREYHRIGIEYLEAVTALLRRVRGADSCAGLLEAADMHWWWRVPRNTDRMPQMFWFDDSDRPMAAVIATDWGDSVALDPIVMPGAPPDWVAHVIERGLAHAAGLGLEVADVVVDREDQLMRQVLERHGFDLDDGGSGSLAAGLSVICAWISADERPAISPLLDGYQLRSRLDSTPRPHHMIGRSGPDVETRLLQASLYRPDLDLFVLDAHDRVAAYGLFWFDPETATGLVEPMRTEEGHQQLGLGRHVLTSGLDLLARAGATRVKICFKPDNDAARSLYLGVGFQPDRQTVVLSRRALRSAV